MPINYDRLMSLPALEQRVRYSTRDVILYALGLGVGADDPYSENNLRYIYERSLQVLPTMAVVIGSPGFWLQDPIYDVDWRRVLHGEQSITLHDTFPPEAEVFSRLKIHDIFDKGADKGAIIIADREITDVTTGKRLATLRSTSFLRGDGGFGGKNSPSRGAPLLSADRSPDLSVDVSTRQDLATLYRLLGDSNPLHIDPAVARAAGFPRPILHGLCTYGIVGRVLLDRVCRGETSLFRSFTVRFSSPVFPGETIRTEIWHGAGSEMLVRAKVVERDLVVLDHGSFHYGAAA